MQSKNIFSSSRSTAPANTKSELNLIKSYSESKSTKNKSITTAGAEKGPLLFGLVLCPLEGLFETIS